MSRTDEIYIVHCAALPQKPVYLKRDPNIDVPVVWCDLAKLIRIWENSPRALLIPRASEWEPAAYRAYREGIENTSIPYTVANVQAHQSTQIGRLLVPRISFGWDEGDQMITAGFVNGRHRTRMLEDLGASAIPVQIDAEEAEQLTAECLPPSGTSLTSFYDFHP